MKKAFLLVALLCTACSGSDTSPIPDVEPATLESYSDNRPMLINFFATWCSFCKDELPILEDIAKRNDVTVLGINLQESAERVGEYWQSGEYTFPYILDPESKYKKQFGVFTQPTTIVLDESGKQVWRKDGPFTRDELADVLTRFDLVESGPGLGPDSIDDTVSDPIPDPDPKISDTTLLLHPWYGDQTKHSIPLEDVLSGGPPKDGIPALDEPSFLSIDQASFLEDQDVGILVSIEGDTRFYPYDILIYHEIVNDTVGGIPIAVTYCPLCATGVVYGRIISTGETTFGVSGMLYQNNLLMYDRETESLWNQVTAESVVGPLTSEKLAYIESSIVHFGTVKDVYPNAQVLSSDTGYIRPYGTSPYGDYNVSNRVIFPVQKEDDRLHSKALVYGIVVDGIVKAYPEERVRFEEEILDTVNGKRVLITYDASTEKVQFENLDEKTSIPFLPVFWFSWVAQYPGTLLYEVDVQ